MRTLALILVAALAAPAAAQTICRTDALGGVACSGTPPARWKPFEVQGGLETVQRRPQAKLPVLVPSWRSDVFGDTMLRPGEAPGPGARCQRTKLGHLSCS